MQTDLLWAGIEYHSLENCVLTKTAEGIEANSSIVGAYDDKIYRVEYFIRTNFQWQTVFLEVKTQISAKTNFFIYHGDGQGKWTRNGMQVPELEGCIDVDISLTPFTNTLPMNRLQWELKKPQVIKVLFVDVLAQEVAPVQQQYTKISLTEFNFQNVPNDFEAVISVDELNLVTNYPALFVRNARRDYR